MSWVLRAEEAIENLVKGGTVESGELREWNYLSFHSQFPHL